MTQDRPNRLATASVLGLFLLSGAVALVYQVTWARQMGLAFGQTAQAAAVVLAAFFVGLAIGYRVAGPLSQSGHPLARYGVAEILAGLTALGPLAAWWWAADLAAVLPDAWWTPFAETLLCFGLLLPTSICLGATLPLLAQFVESYEHQASLPVQWATIAYGINTLGAFLGVLLTTFVLVGWVGISASSQLAIGGSIGIGIISIVLARFLPGRPSSPPPTTEAPEPTEIPNTFGWLFIAALSGFGTLALEVLYTDLFALVFHNSTYTFGMVVAAFLLSLSAGTLLAAWLQPRFSPRVLTGAALSLGALAVCIAVALLMWIRGLTYFPRHPSFAIYLLSAFGLVLLTVGPPVTLLAMALPVAWRALCDRVEDAGKIVGRLTSINALAGAAGAASIGFIIMPIVGLWGGFALIAAIYLLAGLAMLNEKSRGLAWIIMLPAVPCFLIVITLPFSVPSIEVHEQLIERWSGPYGWTDVVEEQATKLRPANLRLRQNVHYGLGSTDTAVSERRQSRIPLLIHPDPERVFYLGLATGITASEALLHPAVEDITIVELIPQVAEAAKHFRDANLGLLTDDRVKLIVGDARHELRHSQETYDLIISDLFVPWETRTGYLYTVEHFRGVRAKLADEGLFCQWVPVWQVGEREWELIANSMAEVFPHVTVWWGRFSARYPMIALIGSETPLLVNRNAVQQRIEALQATPADDPILRSATDLAFMYAGDWKRDPDAPLNTDDRPLIEFLAPGTHIRRELLSGERLIQYQDRVLQRLPAEAVEFVPPLEMTTAEQRRAQRLLLER